MPKTTAGSTSQIKRGGYRKRRVGYRRRKPTVYALNKRLNMLSKHVSITRETKHYDTAFNTGVSSTPGIFDLCLVPEGDSETQRTGVRINPRALGISLRCTAETGEPSNEFRFIVFRWFDEDFPQPSDILTSVTGGTFFGYNPIDVPINWVVKPRYQILSDKRLALDPESNDTVFYKYSMGFRKNSLISYNGNAGSATENGKVYLLVVTDSVAVPHPQIQGYSRLTFKDA